MDAATACTEVGPPPAWLKVGPLGHPKYKRTTSYHKTLAIFASTIATLSGGNCFDANQSLPQNGIVSTGIIACSSQFSEGSRSNGTMFGRKQRPPVPP